MRALSTIVMMVALGAAAPASAGETPPVKGAGPSAHDAILVVDEKHLDRIWQPLYKGTPRLSLSLRSDRFELGCVSLGFVIDTDGRVRDAHVLRSDPPGMLDAGGLRRVRALRYRPGPDNSARQPAYSVVTWSYGSDTLRKVSGAILPCLVDTRVAAAPASP